MKITRLFSAAVLFLFSIILMLPRPVSAATLRSGENLTITEQLKDLYAAGNTVDVTAPVRGDLTIAGGSVRSTDNVSNSVLAAGGNVTISGATGNTIRAAGGSVTIDGPVNNDVVVVGGTVVITDRARINGDLILSGGTLTVNGPVKGNIWTSGGDITLNNTVGGNVWGGSIGNLKLGSQAVINGDLNYSSASHANMANGAVIKGKQNFHQEENKRNETGKGATALLTGGAVYKLIVDILVSLFFIWLLPRFLRRTSEEIAAEPLKAGLLGFATLILMPMISVILLIFLWLGLASFLLYALLLVFAVVVKNIFVGWWALRWWNNREQKDYLLDWKAAVIGPIILFLIALIPVVGWLIVFVLWLCAIGALVLTLWDFTTMNRQTNGRVLAPANSPTLKLTPKPTRSTRSSSPRRKR
jgi:hypothetical protein